MEVGLKDLKVSIVLSQCFVNPLKTNVHRKPCNANHVTDFNSLRTLVSSGIIKVLLLMLLPGKYLPV